MAVETERLHVVRGHDGWTLYCIEDGAPEEGMAVVSGGPERDLLTGTWFADDGHVMRVSLWAAATLTDEFCSMLSEVFGVDVHREGNWP